MGPAHAHAVLEYYCVNQTEYVKALMMAGMHSDEIGTHAALANTSLTLAPALVRVDQLKAEAGKGLEAQEIYGGNPRRSTAELGKLGVELIIQKTVDAIEAAVGCN